MPVRPDDVVTVAVGIFGGHHVHCSMFSVGLYSKQDAVTQML